MNETSEQAVLCREKLLRAFIVRMSSLQSGVASTLAAPWCFDELELAVKRGKTLWLLCVDDTRIVPPAARNLISYPARSREELERHVLTLLEQIKVPQQATNNR
jgi:hypothetical protein